MKRFWIACGAIVLLFQAGTAQSETPVVIEGQVDSESFIFQPRYWPNPSVVLIDLAYVVEGRNDYFVPVQAQVMGHFTDPPFTGEGLYRIRLPIQPAGQRIDGNGDGEAQLGVFAVLAAPSFAATSYLEQMEQDGGMASILRDPLTGGITHGALAVYSADGKETFPAARGADGIWFTADDEAAELPQGWSIARLGIDGITIFDRAENPRVDTIEAAEAKSADFSGDTYTTAFDNLITHLAERYAYTDFRQLDWDALAAEYRPRVMAAQQAADAGAYFLALRDMALSLEDAHTVVSAGYLNEAINRAVLEAELERFGGEIGAAPLVVSDTEAGIAPGEVILVADVAPDTPAAEAGWTKGTRILEVDGMPAGEYLASLPLTSATGVKELHPYLRAPRFFRYPEGHEVAFTYQNPGDEPQEVTMVAGDFPSPYPESSAPASGLPIDIRQVGGLAILSWRNFSDHMLSKVSVLEEALALEADHGSRGMILDLRGNGGGLVELYEIMASYFFAESEPMPDWLFDAWEFDSGAGGFVKAYSTRRALWSPRPELAYTGPLVILIDQGCASACEYFTQHLQKLGRATVVAQHASLGAGGFIDRVNMPEGVTFQYTAARTTFRDTQEPNLEARGVIPDIRVPVTMETQAAFAAGEDPVMDAAFEVIARLSDPKRKLVASPYIWTAAATVEQKEVAIENSAMYKASFSEDGTYALDADCNRLTGRWTLEDGILTLGPGAATATACPGNSQGRDFARIMLGSHQISFDGDKLVVIAQDEKYLVIQLEPRKD